MSTEHTSRTVQEWAESFTQLKRIWDELRQLQNTSPGKFLSVMELVAPSFAPPSIPLPIEQATTYDSVKV
jgi:hypothetical protein